MTIRITRTLQMLSTAILALALQQVSTAATITTVATGLDNPRGLAFGPEGGLYVAEAGKGGAGPCVSGAEGENCFGMSGAITRIDLKEKKQERIATGFGSVAAPDGSFALGPHDIAFLGRGNASIVIGLGNDPRKRVADFGAGGAGLAQLATMPASGKWRLDVDLGAYETSANPDGGFIDDDPYAVLDLPGKRIVVDAGGNDLLQVNANGKITTLAVFPDRMVDAPPFLGLPPGTKIPMQAVPTTVLLGGDGKYYVGQLTGFPFPPGGAKIYRVPANGGTPEVYLEGFTNIIDIAASADGSLYVLEISKNGLTSGDMTGALIRVAPNGTRTEIAPGALTAPGGVAIGPDGNLYVTNNSVFPGTGSVLKIQP